MGDLMRSQREHFASVLEEAADRVPGDLPVRIVRFEGQPAMKIAEVSSEFDLLFVGSRGFGPLRRVLLGSVSSELMRTVACPLVVTPKGVAALNLAPQQTGNSTATSRSASTTVGSSP
jgi:nucleotide-binding universal stress UspA family protein